MHGIECMFLASVGSRSQDISPREVSRSDGGRLSEVGISYLTYKAEEEQACKDGRRRSVSSQAKETCGLRLGGRGRNLAHLRTERQLL